MYRTLHQSRKHFLLYPCGIFTKIDHNLKIRPENAVKPRITGLSPLVDGDVKQYSHFDRIVWQFLTKLNTHLL